MKSRSDETRCAITTLTGFRTGLHQCWTSWPDAAFELTDTVLCMPSPVASVPALSLEPAFRRSHGSLYKALARGAVDDEAMRELLVEHRPSGWPLVFAVDASTWPRCDAETSPQRGYYYSASKHSAGQPIVAGWSYQWITQLDWAADSWTAPMDAQRIPVGSDTTTATVAQVSDLTRRLHHSRIPAQPGSDHTTAAIPIFVFDAGYDPIALTHELGDLAATIVVRIRDDRVFYTDPAPTEPGTIGRPRRHGHRFSCANPPTWPAPDTELHAQDRRYGTVHVQAWSGLHPKTRRTRTMDPPRRPADRDRNRHPHRRRTPTQTHHTHQKDAVAMGCRPGPDRPRHVLASLLAPLRYRAHLPVLQEHPRMDHPTTMHPRPGRPVDLAHRRRLHPTSARPTLGRRPATALGKTRQARQTHPRPCPARVSTTYRNTGHTGQPTKTQQSRPRTPQRNPPQPPNPPPRHKENRLTRRAKV